MADDDRLNDNSNPGETVDNSEAPVDNFQQQQGSEDTPKQSTGWGGKRKGAGRKKGSMNKRSVEKMKVKEQLENRIAKHAQELFNAQITLAKGTQHLFWRYKIKTKKGWRWSKFELVTDPERMMAYLDGEYSKNDNEYFMLTTDKPDAHSIDSLLDRAFGKAPQNLNIKDDREDPIATLLAAFGLLNKEGDSNAGKTSGSSEETP